MIPEPRPVRPLEVVAVLALTGAAAWLRFANLGFFTLWGDDGFTYLAVRGVLDHGVPRIPECVYWKSLLYTYAAAAPGAVAGVDEWTLRLPAAAASTALVPMAWWLGRRVWGTPVGLVAAAVLTGHVWEVELSRHARYYPVLQLLVLVYLERFHRRYVENVPAARWGLFAAFAALLATHTIALAMALWFGPLVLLTRFRILREKSFWLEAGAIAAMGIAWLGFESTWTCGFVVNPDEGDIGVIDAFLRDFDTGIVEWLPRTIPRTLWGAGGGIGLWLAVAGARRVRVRGDSATFVWTIGAGLALFFLCFGDAHAQPRYLIFLVPVLILLAVGSTAGALQATLPAESGPGRATLAAVVGALVGGVFAMRDARIELAVTVPDRDYVHRIPDTRYQPSTARSFVWDHQNPARFVAEHRKPGDRVLGMHPIYAYVYTERLDGWIWHGTRWTWDAYHDRDGDGVFEDNYIGAPLVWDFETFRAELAKPGRTWVLQTPSVTEGGVVDPRIRRFLEERPDALVAHGRDRISAAYLFENGRGGFGEAGHRILEVEAMPGRTGRPVADAEASRIVAREVVAGRDPGDFVSFGPYRRYPAGPYRARFRLAGEGAGVRIEAFVARTGPVLAAADLRVDGGYADHELAFTLEEETELELRIAWSGEGTLRADRIDLVPGPLRPGATGPRILCAGDSITAGPYPAELERILRDELGLDPVVVNGGRPGHTTREYRRDPVLRQLLPIADPDVVLLGLGTNDVRVDGDHVETEELRTNLATILGRIRSYTNRRGAPPAVLLATPPALHRTEAPFDARSADRLENEIAPAIRELARAEGLDVAELFDLFLDPDTLGPDRVHPTDAGYERIARAWARRLMDTGRIPPHPDETKEP